MDQTGEPQKSLSVLTPKAAEEFASKKESLEQKLDTAWDAAQKPALELDLVDSSEDEIKIKLNQFKSACFQYNRYLDELTTLFVRANTSAIPTWLDSIKYLRESRKNWANTQIETANTKMSKLQERRSMTLSRKTRTSASQATTTVSIQAAVARAEAAALSAASSIGREQVPINLERAKIDEEEAVRNTACLRHKLESEANMELLEHEENSAAAQARAEVLNEGIQHLQDDELMILPVKKEPGNLPISKVNHL